MVFGGVAFGKCIGIAWGHPGGASMIERDGLIRDIPESKDIHVSSLYLAV